MFADVGCHNLATLRVGVGEYILNKIIAKLVARDCSCCQQRSSTNDCRCQLTVNQRHTRAVRTSLANTVEVAIEKIGATNLQALLNDLGGKLIHAVLGGKTQDVVDGAATVRRAAVLTDVLDAPVAELTMGHHIDAGKNLVDARAL